MLSTSTDDQQESRIAEPGEACPNCGEALLGQWCYRCGQNQRSIHRFFPVIVAEALDDVFSWNSRTGRTFFGLLFRPGFLANEFFAGRRASYLPPVRVYLITSFLFFFLLSVQNTVNRQDRVVVVDPKSEDVEAAIEEAGADPEAAEFARRLSDRTIDLRLPLVSPERTQQINEQLNRQMEKLKAIGEEDPGAVIDAILDVVPPAVFVLLPLFALLLKIFYFSFGFYYVEHLILAINNHSFLFTILTVESLLGMLPETTWGVGVVTTAIFTWIPVYMLLSLRAVYRQGWFATAINYALLGLFYLVLLTTTTVAAMLIGLLSL